MLHAKIGETKNLDALSPRAAPPQTPAKCWDAVVTESGATSKRGSREAETGGKLPLITIEPGELPRVVDEAEAALVRAGLGVYQRGPFIVRPGVVKVAISDGRSVSGQQIIKLGEHGLMEAMSASARWVKYDARSGDYVRADAPLTVARVYLDRRGRWNLPVLTGIVNAPTLRWDGSILHQPGYDEETGLIFDPCGADFPAVPASPTRQDALGALAALKRLIETFPFVGAADRSVALSALLTACVRRSLRTAPLHGFSAPLPGSGKSKLADLASVLATGREAGVIAQGPTDSETEKRLGALLLAGEAVIAIDNVERQLGGEFLCQALSQDFVRSRILRKSEAPELPANALVTATGNNLTLHADITRRALLCQIDPRCERPELREFAEDPIDVAKGQRGALVAAALTVLRAHQVAGLPKQPPPLGGFTSWSRRVRDALLWLGEADPVETMELARELDPKLEVALAVLNAWHSSVGPEPITAKGLVEEALKHGRPRSELHEALLVVAGAGGTLSPAKLGYWIRANRDRQFGGLRLVRDGITHGTPRWRVDACPGVLSPGNPIRS